MKILLFGKGGQVGWELQRSLSTVNPGSQGKRPAL
jgi:dTDP-4-dehydrorhamnose reductase